MSGLPKIHLHADDFGMSELSNARILESIGRGLNGISILPDGKALSAVPENVLCCVHLDLVEGRALSSPADVPLLADENGFFRNSFVQLLKRSLGGEKSAFAAQLRAEIRLQLEKGIRLLPPGTPVGLDSHQHTHMIPLIFRTLLEEAEALRLNVAYVRVPAEPLTPFMAHPSIWGTLRPVNLVKSLVLNTLFLFSKRRFRESGLPTQVFFGILLSGRMDARRVCLLLPDFLRIAKKRGMGLEILFHPGSMPEASRCMDPRKKGFVNFYLSSGRQEEYEAVAAVLKSAEKENVL